MPDDTSIEVNANPVKEFFINILTRDVKIIDTIPEFVDNSIDGASRIRDDEEYSGLYVNIELSEDRAVLTDNCGGIPRDIAENYAFRFGRPNEYTGEMDSLIGKFGVGMKRSLFKLGDYFLIESSTEDNHFVIEVDLDEWEEHDEWNFEMELVNPDEDERCELSEHGTRIVIEELDEQVSEKFEQDLFISRLSDKLTSKNRNYLKDGLQIILNDEPLGYTSIDLLKSDDLEPAYEVFQFEENGESVQVEIRAGLGESNPDEAGWYIFCNGRLVLEANTEEVTGWDGETIPKFHGEYNRFRGLVNFVSDDPGALPWNTTKTGVNPDTPVYQKARQEMQSTMRPIIDFMSDIAEQKKESESEEDVPLEVEVKKADPVDADELETVQTSFAAPDAEEEEESEGPETTHISYERPVEKVEEIKELLDITTNKEVGEKTFDYYYEFEVEEY